MRFIETGIAGAWLIEPAPRFDERGNFFRAWCTREFQEQGIEFTPLQANMGFSLHKGTVRGLHYQTEAAPEAKLVRCTRGAMFDVVVDLRPGSLSWGKWFGVELTSENASTREHFSAPGSGAIADSLGFISAVNGWTSGEVVATSGQLRS